MEFYSNGKLLLTGEYLVLDGANAFAVPTKFGQNLIVEKIVEPQLIWGSFTNTGNSSNPGNPFSTFSISAIAEPPPRICKR